MVKLASARENRLYGPPPSHNRWEYINAGLYIFCSILLLIGCLLELFSGVSRSALVILLISVVLMAAINMHDLFAHLAGIDFRLSLIGGDKQIALVEIGAPLIQMLGSILTFLGLLFLVIQVDKGRHGLSLLIAGPALWVLGSIHNSCQVYERADSYMQILQKAVHLPFLLGSLLFLVGGILSVMMTHDTLDRGWGLFGAVGSFLFLFGGMANVLKVFKMQGVMMDVGRLEKLRGGAQERLYREREGRLPLLLDEQRRRTIQHHLPDSSLPATTSSAPTSTPYKDVLVGITRDS
ncbi:hypothetical protein AMTRI_Chr01g130740 [Amborella trichopoda]